MSDNFSICFLPTKKFDKCGQIKKIEALSYTLCESPEI